MNDTVNGALSEAAHFIEAILCEFRPCSPRELVLSRVAASMAKSAAEAQVHLVNAASLSDNARDYSWTDALRSHFELAEFYWRNDNPSACAAELHATLAIIKRYFSAGNRYMAEMHRVRAACLRAVACELGAAHSEQQAAIMDRGGRRN
jgi:hypothetical protein